MRRGLTATLAARPRAALLACVVLLAIVPQLVVLSGAAGDSVLAHTAPTSRTVADTWDPAVHWNEAAAPLVIAYSLRGWQSLRYAIASAHSAITRTKRPDRMRVVFLIGEQADPQRVCAAMSRWLPFPGEPACQVAVVDEVPRVGQSCAGWTMSGAYQGGRDLPPFTVVALPTDAGEEFLEPLRRGRQETRPELIQGTTFTRMYLPWIMHALGQPRVLYLDTDTLPRADLQELFDAAVTPETVLTVAHPRTRKCHSAWRMEMNVPDVLEFNSGVLLFHVEEACEFGFIDRYMEVLERHASPEEGPLWRRGLQQPPMCIMLKGRVSSVHSTWNSKNSCEGQSRIFHWTGEDKPWVPGAKVDEEVRAMWETHDVYVE